ncbi:Hpt domain-containing protein [Bdellovibrio bacteriovorus]|uniref:Hpt domain-containing protein n=1 Tax=Bdellovibrio bacteriovorus TaxID=959 RepID=UPI003D0701E7
MTHTEEKIRRLCPEVVASGLDPRLLSQMLDTRFLGNFSIFSAAADAFLYEYAEELEELQAFIENLDRQKAFAATHKLKGSLINFHRPDVAETARILEIHTEDWSHEQLREQFAILQIQIQEFAFELKLLMKSFEEIQDLP